MNKEYLSAHCPYCGSRIYRNSHGYQCEHCNFQVKNYICNRHLNKEEMEKVLMGEEIIVDGFSTNTGKIFSSIPVIQNYTIVLDNTIALLQQGRIVVGTKSFVCEPFQREKSIKFRVQRMYNGHQITVGEIKTLLQQGKVVIDTLDESGNRQNNELILLSKQRMKVSFT